MKGSELPARRGIYFLEERPEAEGGLYLWVRHAREGETRKRKYGRKLAPYFERRGWSVARHLNDKRIMEVVAEVRAEVDAGGKVSPGPPEPPLVSLIQDYHEDLASRELNARYVHEQRRRLLVTLGRGAKALAGGVRPLPWGRPGEIARKDLQRFLAERGRAGASPQDRTHDLRAWSAFANWLVEREILAASPLAGMRGPARRERPPRVLSAEEVARFLEASSWAGGLLLCTRRDGSVRKVYVPAAPPWLRPAVAILSYTGMRPCELGRLSWQDVDLERRTITVNRKGGKPWVVPVVDGLAALLEGIRPPGARGPLVPGFPHREDSSPGNYTRAVRAAARRAGLPGVTLYSLRHSVATELARGGLTTQQLQAVMGWRSARMAERYVHLSGSDVEGALDGLPWAQGAKAQETATRPARMTR